jgi:hypothetical protein
MTNGMTTPPTDYHALSDSASVAEPTVLITSPPTPLDTRRRTDPPRLLSRRPSTAGLAERLVG